MKTRQTFTSAKARKVRARRVSKTHAFYERLRVFREDWETLGGTRGTLRKARKLSRTLYPPLPGAE